MRKTISGLVAIGLTLALAACGDAKETGVKANMGATVGISLPTKLQTRWIADGDNMVKQFTNMGYKTDMLYADDDAKNQAAQIQTMIDRGAKLLVIAAVDSSPLTAVLAKANNAGIPVIAYDRLILDSPNVDYYATFDGERVGVLQANLLVQRLGLRDGKGPFTIELFAGSPTDNNAKVFFDAAMSVLTPYIKAGKLVVRSGEITFDKVATVKWDGPTAGKRMRALLSTYYPTGSPDAVLSPNDGLAQGILKAFGGRKLPIITGQDAELASVKSIIAGKQTGTIYKDTRELAKVAVQMGNALLTGAKPIVNDTTTYDNGVKTVPTYLLYPVAVNKSNYKTLLVDGGYYTKADLGG